MHAHMHIYNIYLMHGWGLLFKKYRCFVAACMHYSGGILKNWRSLRERLLGQSWGWKRKNVEKSEERTVLPRSTKSQSKDVFCPQKFNVFFTIYISVFPAFLMYYSLLPTILPVFPAPALSLEKRTLLSFLSSNCFNLAFHTIW